MRVIAGVSRGRTLRAPAGGGTRPTGDRVREAVFDILQAQVELPGAQVADLFAGSGAMGIEALSRGAASAVFVDADRRAVAAVRANLEATGLAGSATVVRRDVLAWLAEGGGGRRFDLCFCDPPYAFDAWPALLGRLPADRAVLETDRPPEVPDGWEVTRVRRYGGTLVTVVAATHRSEEGAL